MSESSETSSVITGNKNSCAQGGFPACVLRSGWGVYLGLKWLYTVDVCKEGLNRECSTNQKHMTA